MVCGHSHGKRSDVSDVLDRLDEHAASIVAVVVNGPVESGVVACETMLRGTSAASQDRRRRGRDHAPPHAFEGRPRVVHHGGRTVTARVHVVGLTQDLLHEDALAALAAVRRVLGAPGDVAAVRHVLPPTVQPQPVEGDIDALVAAACDSVGPVGVVAPAGKPLWRLADRLGGVLGIDQLQVFPGEPRAAGATERRKKATTAPPPVTVVGLSCTGADAGVGLDSDAHRALAEAGLVVGTGRHLTNVDALVPAGAIRRELAGDLRALDDVVAATAPAIVLASGDPGFFGVVRALRQRLEAADEGVARLRVRPAVSSVAAVFAAAGVSWDDAVVVSAYGRDPHVAVHTCRRFPKVAVLTEPGFGPAQLARALDGRPRRWVVGEGLGTPGARITSSWPTLEPRDWVDATIVAVIDDAAPTATKGLAFPARRSPHRWALPEDAFDHRDTMITKAEVRAVVLARLGPGVGDLVWDIGAGSGAVAVEAARLGAAVAAVEDDAQQCGRIRRNAERHEVPVEVVHARAPDALDSLADPDAVFVGGGGHLITEIVRRAADRTRRVVVVALATIERVPPVQRALADAGLTVDGTLLHASRLQALGGGHQLAATNPVFIVEGRR